MIEPFLRVKHSKKVVAEEIVTNFPRKFARFVDATATDAVVFAEQPRTPSRCILNFTNPDTLTLYEAVQAHPENLITEAAHLWEDLSKEEFESLLAADQPPGPAEAAAHLLYLNHLSQPGATNYDRNHKADRFTWDTINEWSQRLEKVKLQASDPFELLDTSRPTDLVYVDTSTGVDIEPLLEVAVSSPAQVVVVDSTEGTTEALPDSVHQTTLSRCRPGLHTPDDLYLKTH